MHKTIIIFIFAFLISFINAEIEQDGIFINCATPCIPINNCYTSTCDTTQGLCVQTVKSVLSEGCCFSASDCRTGDCVFSSCNLDVNQCEYIEICPNSGFNITRKACLSDSQCQGGNPCALSKCIDNVCQTSPLTNPNNNLCCQSASDCAPSPCSEKFCDVGTFTCFYVPIKGCEISFGETIVPYYPPVVTSSSSSYSTYAELYDIPTHPDAGAIFFTIIGSIILFLVVVIFIAAVLYTIYDYFVKKEEEHDALGEAAAAGHTHHGH